MENSTLTMEEYSYKIFFIVGSYFPLVIISFGFVGNLAALLLFTVNTNLNTLSPFIYLAFISIVDTLSLFNWNLDHFLKPNFNISAVNSSIIPCKLLSFFQNFGLQASGILHCLLIIDLYYILTNNRFNHNRRHFATVKSAVVWSIGILSFLALINLHFLILNGYWTFSKELETNTSVISANKTIEYQIGKITKYAPFECNNYPFNLNVLLDIWIYVLLCIYNLIPSVVIPIVVLIILCKIHSIRKKLNKNAKKHYLFKDIMRISYSVVIISILFILMTAPTQIM